jgi:hypothetical protein
MEKAIQLPDLESLERGGALVKDEGGVRVKVLLYYPADLAPRSMEERKTFLHKEFSRLRRSKALKAVEVDFDRLSVAGQSVRAVIPVNDWVPSVSRLVREGLRVIPRKRFKAVGFA